MKKHVSCYYQPTKAAAETNRMIARDMQIARAERANEQQSQPASQPLKKTTANEKHKTVRITEQEETIHAHINYQGYKDTAATETEVQHQVNNQT